MKTVSMVGTFPPHKGISDTCVEQVKSLCGKVRIKFIDFRHLYPKWLYPGTLIVDDFEIPRLEHVTIARIISWYNPFSWIKAAFAAEGEILHVHWWTYVLFAPLFTIVTINRWRGRTIVCNVHNVRGHESNPIDTLCTRVFLSRIDCLIAHTADSKAKIHRQFNIDRSRIEVIPLGIPDFIVGRASRPEARNRLGIDAHKKVILCFGHIRKYKGIGTLIQAFAQVRRKMDDCLLVIAGETWVDWKPYQDLIDSLGVGDDILLKLAFIDIRDVKYYFHAADLVVLPYSHFDGQSGPGRIALGYQKPMVVSNVGGLPDLVPKVCVFQAGNVDELAQKIHSIVADEEVLHRLHRYAKAKNEALKWANIAGQTLALYRRRR